MKRYAVDGLARAGSPGGPSPLPERVRRVIADQQAASEVLIGWVQLAVVLLFGALYMVAPKPPAPGAVFTPVPWALGTYLVFTVMRLVIALRGRIPDWMLYASVVVDMALLFGLIWSFHVQYMQPPSFYLKAPTLLYVFIFIALRALRFEVRFVVFAGICATLGWTALVIYSAAATPGADVITRDYVQYMTGNLVLIGAEIDKIVSILTVTAILAVAIARARALLVRSVAEGAAVMELSRFFSPEIAAQITASEQAVRVGQGQARLAVVMLIDIRGFTAFASTAGPDMLMATLADYQARMVPIIQRHGGAIDKFMGDGIMASFGAAVVTDTFAADALRACDAVAAEAEAWSAERRGRGLQPLSIGAACASGPVVFGAVGDETRLEYTVIGDAVNRAAKLEKHTKVEEVRALTDAATYREARAQGYAPACAVEHRDGRVVDGIGSPVDIVVLAP